MAYASDATHTRGHNPRSQKLNFAPEVGSEWMEPEKPPRDVKKLFLVAGLGILSWVATYIGMLELIQSNMGDLPLVHKAVIGFSVAMLMTMIIWLLDQMFAPIGSFTKLCYIAGYLFLSIISVGFGFGFYWKVLESRSESSRSAVSAVSQVQVSLHAASTRLEQLNATLVQLAALSKEKAELERTKGTSCPNSRPGDGPRRKMREDDAARFTFSSEFVKGRVGAVNGDLAALNGDLALISGNDKSIIDAKTGTRNEFMNALGRKLDMTAAGFNAFRTDPQLRQLRTDLDARAEQSTFGDPKKGGFVCPDPQLQQALRGAVRAIDQLPELQKPEIAAVEGSEATIEAFRRLTATFYGLLSFKLPPSADELRALQQKAIQSVEANAARPVSTEAGGLSKRDYVPLSIAIFVDICLLLVSMGRPMHRLNGLVPKMREAERGPVIQILSRFNEIHRDPEIRQNFDLFRHVVFDYHGDYYVAVPLDAPKRMNPDQRLELQHEAHLLANLFTSFEKERIFKRIYNPLLNSASVQKRLRRQGSKFAECDAFRTYRFRDGAWSEFILGAVMGAARRVEAAKRREMIEQDFLRAGNEPAFATRTRTNFTVPQPVVDPTPAIATPRAIPHPAAPLPDVEMPASVKAAIARRTSAAAAQSPGPSNSSAPRPKGVSPDFASSYGPYSHAAQSELAASEGPADAEVSVKAANSNTAPHARKANAAAIKETSDETTETVIPLYSSHPRPNLRSNLARAEPEADLIADTHDAARMRAVGDRKIDVVLRRETATVSMPAADMENSLIDRLGQALAGVKPALGETVTGETITSAAPVLQIEAQLEAQDLEEAGEEEITTAVDEDPAHDDAISIAGRLRPAIPAE